jgi:hypothetical protein
MNIDKYVSIGGLPGIFKMVANRAGGLIVEDLKTKKTQFVASRKHQFNPLASIAIYTEDDSVELRHIFRSMLEQIETNPPANVKGTDAEIREYFTKILPAHDRDRVYVSDIKKVIKWFIFLKEADASGLTLDPDPVQGGEEAVEK